MSDKDNGGPAFPTDELYDEKKVGQVPGMNLRDYFAGKALTGLLADMNTSGDHHDFAKCAYQYADAMIAERAK